MDDIFVYHYMELANSLGLNNTRSCHIIKIFTCLYYEKVFYLISHRLPIRILGA